MSHAPEPWVFCFIGSVGAYGFMDIDGNPICHFGIQEEYDNTAGIEPTQDDIDRIVACINFCREFPTEFLVKYQMHHMPDEFPSIGRGGKLAAIKGFFGLVPIKKADQ